MAFFVIAPQLKYATYFPATLATGLVSGTPAAIVVALLAFLVEWWAFSAPAFHLGPFDRATLMALITWVANIGLVLLISYWGDLLLDRLSNRERELNLITRELQHRGRNTYAVIESVVRRTLPDDPERAATLAGRIRSIKYANDIMADAHATGVQLRTLLRFELEPYGHERLDLAGLDLKLRSDAARNLVLIFHELTTNAVKYGSLSGECGQVGVRWAIQGQELAIDWKEYDGPPVRNPERQGFGSTLIAQCAASLAAEYSQSFEPDGFEARLVLPLASVAYA